VSGHSEGGNSDITVTSLTCTVGTSATAPNSRDDLDFGELVHPILNITYFCFRYIERWININMNDSTEVSAKSMTNKMITT
jgi:hypothetical protein